MATTQITKYAAWITPNNNEYRLGLWTQNNSNYQINLSGPEEMNMIIDLLRNEKPCWYDSNNQKIIVGYEPVGEGEA